jgi:hypothetical protein
MPIRAQGLSASPPNSRLLIAAGTLAIIYVFATYARFSGLGWDDYSGLHPDERHMVFTLSRSYEALAQRGVIAGLTGWLWPTGPLSPRGPDSFYVYGDLPHAAGSLLAWFTNAVGWDTRLAVGRLISATADSATVLVVFFLVRSAWDGFLAALVAAFLYASIPLAIQHANFYVVDSTATLFGALTMLAALSVARKGGSGRAALMGVALAAAIACKISMALFAIVVPLALAIRTARLAGDYRKKAASIAREAASAVSAALIGVLILNPSAFGGPLEPWPNPIFIKQVRELTALANLQSDLPHAWQWTLPNRHVAAFRDLLFWAVGPGVAILAVVGVIVLASRAIRDAGVRPALVILGVVFVLCLAFASTSVPALSKVHASGVAGRCCPRRSRSRGLGPEVAGERSCRALRRNGFRLGTGDERNPHRRAFPDYRFPVAVEQCSVGRDYRKRNELG